MNVNYNYLNDQFADFDSYIPELRALVASAEFTLGPYVDQFEKKFAKFIGVKHVISTNTGTDALILALKSVGVKPGHEVITVANTFYATVGAIVAVGARPVFVDSDERYSIDVGKIEKAITQNTRALLPVHWGGQPADMEAIMEIAKKHNLEVVEDACPSAGAKINGRCVGTFGRANGFSMHPLKPLNVWGDGGMITTNDDQVADWLRKYRNHGMVDRDHIDMWGVNCRLQPVQAIVGTRMLDNLERFNQRRVDLARRFDQGLSDLQDFVRTPSRPEKYDEVYQLYLVNCQRRDELLKFLIANGIEAKVHYPVPLHLQKPARELGYKEGDFPLAEQQAREVITLPAHQHVSNEQADYVIAKIREFYLT